MMAEDSLTILLIEDNPGDARLIREMIKSIESLDYRFDGGRTFQVTDSNDASAETHASRDTEMPNVVHADRLSTGLDEIERGTVDIILLDLNLPDSRGLDTLDAVIGAAPTVPIVVLTGLQDRELGLTALDHGAQEYLVKDEINADLLVRSIYHAIQRERYERELERQHERLATLYECSTLVQEIGGVLIDHSTREEIESTVCDRLVGSDVYRFAWIGRIDQGSGTVIPRADAVADGFFDGWTISIDDRDDPGPIATAALTEDVQVVQNADVAREYGDWREHASEFEYRSLAVIPIAYEDALYGILVVYSDRPNAFENEERGIMQRLGNVVGHAINAVERKTALMSDTAIELELLLPDFFDDLDGESWQSDTRIEFLMTVPTSDDSYLQYATIEGFSEAGFKDVLDQFPGIQDIREIEDTADRHLIEIQYTDPPILSTLAAHGGHIRSASIVDGDYHATVDLPVDTDVRSFVESIRESHPDVDLVAQRSVEPTSASGHPMITKRDTSLTDKQRAALEAAYFSGYFNQPRLSTGEEIANSLGITASTFHQHLQAGLRKLLAAEFEGRSRIDESDI